MIIRNQKKGEIALKELKAAPPRKKRRTRRRVRRLLNGLRATLAGIAGIATFLVLYISGCLPMIPPVSSVASDLEQETVLAGVEIRKTARLEEEERQRELRYSSRILEKSPIIAHRGLHTTALENSFDSFDAALAAGFNQVELDVLPSSDGILYVCHDDSLQRTTGVPDLITSTPASVLDGILEHNGKKLPRLSEVAERYGNSLIMLVELKQSDDKTLAGYEEFLLGHPDIQKTTLTQGWDVSALEKLREKFPYMFLQYLVQDEKKLDEGLKSSAIDSIAIDQNLLTQELVDRIHQAGKECWVWTVDDTEQMKKLKSWNVEGVITDEPQKAREVFL